MAKQKPNLQIEKNADKSSSADCIKRFKAYAEAIIKMNGGKENE